MLLSQDLLNRILKSANNKVNHAARMLMNHFRQNSTPIQKEQEESFPCFKTWKVELKETIFEEFKQFSVLAPIKQILAEFWILDGSKTAEAKIKRSLLQEDESIELRLITIQRQSKTDMEGNFEVETKKIWNLWDGFFKIYVNEKQIDFKHME